MCHIKNLFVLLFSVLFARNAPMFIPERDRMFFFNIQEEFRENLGRQKNEKRGHVVDRKTQLSTGKVCGVMNASLAEVDFCTLVPVDTLMSTNGALADSLELRFRGFTLIMLCWEIPDNLHSCLFDSVASAGKAQNEGLSRLPGPFTAVIHKTTTTTVLQSSRKLKLL